MYHVFCRPAMEEIQICIMLVQCFEGCRSVLASKQLPKDILTRQILSGPVLIIPPLHKIPSEKNKENICQELHVLYSGDDKMWYILEVSLQNHTAMALPVYKSRSVIFSAKQLCMDSDHGTNPHGRTDGLRYWLRGCFQYFPLNLLREDIKSWFMNKRSW